MTDLKPKQMSIKEASMVYRIPEWTLRKYIALGIMPYRRVRTKIYLPVDKFEAWLSRGDVEPIKHGGAE